MLPPSVAPRNPIESPECPNCGCNATELINAGMRWGRPWAEFGCDHCGQRFGLGARPRTEEGKVQYRVPFPKLQCPQCGSKKTETRSSPAAEKNSGVKFRYHRCLECACDFSSFEE